MPVISSIAALSTLKRKNHADFSTVLDQVNYVKMPGRYLNLKRWLYRRLYLERGAGGGGPAAGPRQQLQPST